MSPSQVTCFIKQSGMIYIDLPCFAQESQALAIVISYQGDGHAGLGAQYSRSFRALIARQG